MPMKTENKTNHYIDLHAHLDGCITVDIAKKLAALQQITLPAATDEELLSLLSVPDTCENLNDFLKCFDLPLSLLQTEEALEEAVYLILSEMRKDGVIYAELRFAPQLHTQKEMTQETAIHAALRGLKRAPIPGNLMLHAWKLQSAGKYGNSGLGPQISHRGWRSSCRGSCRCRSTFSNRKL